MKEDTESGDDISECLELITGSSVKKVNLEPENLEALGDNLEDWNSNKQAMVVVSKNEKNKKNLNFYPLHPFTIMKVNNPLKRVTLRDPYGPNHRALQESKNKTRARNLKQDGIFSISFEELATNFDTLFVEEQESPT